MKKRPAFLFIVLLFAIVTQAQLPWRLNEKQIAIHFGSDTTAAIKCLSIIKQGNASGMNVGYEESNGFIRCYVTSDELEFLRGHELSITIEIENLNTYSQSFLPRGVPPGYYTFDELNQIADSLSSNFPEICSKHVLGFSSGFHQIVALKISDNSSLDENEPSILFDGGIHGDEIGASENMIRFARDLCVEYGVNDEITFAVDHSEIWIIYCLNPYGRNFMTRYNANGVDINRDGGYMWNGEGSSPGVFSQPETRILRDLLREQQFVIHASYHSGIEYISHPWSYRQDAVPDFANHSFLAQQYSLNSGYSNLTYGQGFSGMYAINGSTKDFGYGSTGAISWSVEISVNKQPASSLIESYYLKNKPAMLAVINNCINQGIHGIISDSITGEPISATVIIDNLFPVNNRVTIGDYHKFLVAGTYSMKVFANGYKPVYLNDIIISTDSQTQVNILMQKEGGYFASNIISCQIPNNNPYDEGYTTGLIGPPDSIAYSIGRYGFLIIDMGMPIINRPGNDIKVYENDNSPEGFRLYAGTSADGPWHQLGTDTATSYFDLSTSSLSKARYIKIADLGTGQSQVPDAGFDLDAIENLHPDTLTVGWIKGVVYTQDNPVPIAGATVTDGINFTLSNELGEYTIATLPGNVSVCSYYSNYWGTDTISVSLGDTTFYDFYLANVDKIQYLKSNTLFAAPNPAKDYVIITGITGKANCRIYNAAGKLISDNQLDIDRTGHLIQTNMLSPGLYLINVYNKGRSHFVKIIFE